MKRKRIERRTLRGVRRAANGKFLPYPLPVNSFCLLNDDSTEVETSIVRSPGGGERPLVLEYRLRCRIPAGRGELTRYLRERARELHVDVKDLPANASPMLAVEEHQADIDARNAVGEVLWLAAMRWADLAEIEAPIKLAVPDEVPVGRDADWDDHDGMMAVEDVILEKKLRLLAVRRLRGEDRRAFKAYCEYWDRQHGRAR